MCRCVCCCQGRGVGSALLAHVEDAARAKGAAFMELAVVNWRTDLRPFYEKRGYALHHSVPFESPHVTRPFTHFNIMRKALA